MPRYVTLSYATERLRRADRVLVVGCSGAGKSTLSRQIATRFGLAYQSFDKEVFWLPGWRLRGRDEQRARVTDLVACPRWVMDGNSPSTFDLRLPRTELVIWLRVPRRVALMGIAQRVFANYGAVRDDMAEGCAEKLPDREFLSYIWNFEKKMSPRIVAALDRYGPDVPVVVLRTRKAAARLLGN